MKHFIIVGNWKMHQTPEQAEVLVERLQKEAKPHTHVTAVVCPPFVSLPAVAAKAERDVLRVGAQNVHENDEGAFTGEVSPPMLKGLAEYVIVGHSERRHFAHETDKQIAKKVAAAVRHDLIPILCVGERLSDRKEGHASRVVVDQLHGSLSQISDDEAGSILVAYEPVWAIGTGESASPEDVRKMVRIIRQTLEEMFGEGTTSRLEVLYGGSTNPDNAKSYLEVEGVGGLLVGGASLNYQHFNSIIQTAADLTK